MILRGDCIEQMRTLDAESIDAIVTDPPYGLGFMGREWDSLPPGDEFAAEALRVLKPGGHLLAFGGTRTYHRLACAIEDAGFEIRDCLAWLYGSGFPKSLDVSKAIDKAAGVERTERTKPKAGHENFVGRDNMKALREGTMSQDGGFKRPWMSDPEAVERAHWDYAPATPEAAQWQGWGTALKPAWESIVWARKPSGEADTIRRSLWLLAEQLRSLASDAESDSSSRPAALDEAFDSAGWTADEQRNTRAALCETMGTSQYESALSTSLSIVSSWSDTLDALCELTSTFTTETASRTTTALTTLKSSLSDLTPHTIIQAATSPDGSALSALPAARAFGAVESRLSATRELLAPAPATSESPADSPEGVAPNSASIVLARKPLTGTVASSVLAHGTGALNVDGTRVGMSDEDREGGRWPANVILDPEAAALLDEQSGERMHGAGAAREAIRAAEGEGMFGIAGGDGHRYGDTGGASRFFYTAKASRAERNAGLEGFAEKPHDERAHYGGLPDLRMEQDQARNPAANVHPTVKPIALMRWLCRLVTPPGGTVLDPFTGSGTTGCAAVLEGFDFIGCEREDEYVAIAEARIAFWSQYPGADTEAVLASDDRRLRDEGQLDLLGEAA